MKKQPRNIVLAVLCGAMAVSAGSCAMSQTYPVTVDGEQLRAGIYILEQQEALNAALSKLREEQPDLDTSAEGFDYFKQTVEGKSFADWINETALENCRGYVATERLFDQNGLTLTADKLSEVNANVKSLWNDENQYAQYYYGVSVIGDYYEKYGISEQSFLDYEINESKSNALFTFLYGEGGSKAATQEEINASLSSDYLALNYFPYELENGATAQSFADRIAGGEEYEEVYRDYAQAIADAEAAANAAAAETADGEESGEIANTDSAEAEAAASAETAATVVEKAEKDSLIQIMKKSSNAPSEEFVKQASAMNNGDVKVITVDSDSGTKTYVVQKLDILSLTEKTKDTVDTIRTDLKTDEFRELIKSTGAGYTLTTDSSINLYKPETLTK